MPELKIKTPVVSKPIEAKTPVVGDAAKEHLAAIRANLKQFVGKRGFNPFLYERDVLLPLEKGLPATAEELLKIPVNVEPKV